MIARASARFFCISGSYPGNSPNLAPALGEGVDEGIAVNAQRHRPPQIQVIEWRLVPVDEQVAIYRARRYFADRIRHLALYLVQQRNCQTDRNKGRVEFSSGEAQYRCRKVLDDGIFNPVEIRAVGFPVIWIARYRYAFVRFELDKFERAGADRMLPHLPRRHVTGVDRRKSVSEQHRQCRLRPLEMKGDLIIAVGGDPIEVAIRGFPGIDPKLLARRIHQQIPGALDVLRRERLAVVPFDAMPQRQGQLGSFLVPRPARRQIGHDRLEAVLLDMLVEHNEVVEHPNIGPSAKTVDSSRIDMLPGLSMLYILRTPPGFCADAVPPADIAISSTLAAARRLSIISPSPVGAFICRARRLPCASH